MLRYVVLIIVLLVLVYSSICIIEILKTQNRISIEPYTRPKKIVVSLTTLPSRMDHLEKTVRSILNNTVQPDMIYINIPNFSKREQKNYEIPDSLKHIPKVTINYIKDDFGPASKLIPTLEKETDPETIIITVDDDLNYDDSLIDHLLGCSNKFPNNVICVCGWNYINLRVLLLPILYPNLKYKPRKVKILQGYCGVIYKRKFFKDDITQYMPCKECFTTDDIYISRYLDNMGVGILQIPHGKNQTSHEYNKDKFALGKENMNGNRWVKCTSVKTCGAIN